MAATEIAPSSTSTRSKAAAPERTPSAWSRLTRALFQPIDPGLVVFFRVAFGAIMLWEVYRYFSKGWIASSFIDPEFHFTYFGFEWVRPWPGNGMYWHFAAMGVLAACVAAGLFYRVAATLFFLAWTYMFLLDQVKYLNHFYLISLVSFLMIFIPAHRAFSLDVLRKPSLYSATVPRWSLWLLRFQIGIAYFYGGLAKCNADWFAGEPMRMFLNSRYGFTPDGRFEPVPETVVWFFTWGGLLFDLLIVPALLWRRTRIAAFCFALVFNFTNDQMFQIGIFPWLMVAATLIFCPPEWLEIGKKSEPAISPKRKRGSANQDPSLALRANENTNQLTGRQKITVGLLGAWVAVMLLFPLRHYLYPGPVSWTEEAHHFAWHMKLRAKDGVGRFVATAADGSRYEWQTQQVFRGGRPGWAMLFSAYDKDGQPLDVEDPAPKLTSRQVDSMTGKPEMILQYAHALGESLTREGIEPLAVSAEVYSSLNGREPQLIVDPQANLLEKRRSLWPADWIVPLTTPMPPEGSTPRMKRQFSEMRDRRPPGGLPPTSGGGVPAASPPEETPE